MRTTGNLLAAGTVTILENAHIAANFVADFIAKAGHLFEGEISVTGEFFIRPEEQELFRVGISNFTND